MRLRRCRASAQLSAWCTVTAQGTSGPGIRTKEGPEGVLVQERVKNFGCLKGFPEGDVPRQGFEGWRGQTKQESLMASY
jgi:hypothetical protein